MELRAATLATWGANCAHCGTGGVPLEVHHVNHDHTDNTTPNLTVLCRRCHALTS